MRTRAIGMLLVLVLLFGCASAQEQLPQLITQDTTIGTNYVRYPQLTGMANEKAQQAINDTIVLDGGIAGYLVTLGTLGEGSLGLQVDGDTTLLGDVLSVTIHAHGKMSNGREGDENRAMVFDLQTGQRLSITDFLADPTSAAQAMEDELYETWVEEFSGYMDSSEISPLPLDNFAAGENGITFFYSSSQVRMLSGYAGAVEFSYSELEELGALKLDEGDALTRMGVTAHKPRTASEIEQLLQEGRLPGVPVTIGDDLPSVLARYRLSRTPDQYPGGRYFVLEAPQFRDVLLLSDGLTPKGYEGSKVEGILSRRCDLLGLGMKGTHQQDWRSLLGQPEATVAYTEQQGYDYGYPAGEMDYYTVGGYQLRLYADSDGLLAFVIFSK